MRAPCSLCAQLALVVLLVTGIHFIEAYGLNPAIYSAHLKLHPLLVLSVLVIAEHSLGVWGLLLAGMRTSASIPTFQKPPAGPAPRCTLPTRAVRPCPLAAQAAQSCVHVASA